VAEGTNAQDNGKQAAAARTVGRFFAFCVPLWALVLVVVAAAVAVGVVALSGDDVDLGPAARHAERIEVEALLCNEEVDAHGVNPREAELRMQDALVDLGADDAKVVVRRRDCGVATTTTREP
jgi:hypothetical protein